jgi:uncharacterized protein YbaA (DUF1428 family)
MPYVDGFVIPIPTKNLKVYRKLALASGKIWLQHGALECRECAGDDLVINGTPLFARAAKAKRGETVLFSWIMFKSKADRNRVNAKVMQDKRIEKMMNMHAMPFDLKRMVYGGFKTLVDL